MNKLFSYEVIDVQERILHNLVKMLSRRIYIKDKTKSPLINYENGLKAIKDITNSIYEFKTPNGKIFVKIILSKITSIDNNASLSDFLDAHMSKDHMIVIVESISDKSRAQLIARGAEVFLGQTLMADVLDYVLQPSFEVLAPYEKEECMKVYNLTIKQFPKMKESDPVARYLNIKSGTVVRVISPSEMCGKNVNYCIVVK
jgi:DNA-directed RNA polymerase subunit H (RpoH/RPB5)